MSNSKAIQLQELTEEAGRGVEAFRTAVADEKALRAALKEADIVPQLLVQAQLSGDRDLLERARPYISGAWSFMEEIPGELRSEIRDRLVSTLQDCVAAPEANLHAGKDDFGRIMSVGIGRPIPDDYVAMLMEEMGGEHGDQRDVHWRVPVSLAALQKRKVVIVGAGVGGLCIAIKLRQAGIPFVIYEKNQTVGGTWFENSYPGAGVDIPNHFYSFSFEPKADWSRHFASRQELWEYLEDCADKYDIRRDIRFGVEVSDVRFDEATSKWHLTAVHLSGETEEVSADIFVSAVGLLNRPAIPRIPGLDDFTGPAFHTAKWDHGVDLTGKRVALVGTGASAMQAGPAIADRVDRLLVFQRSRHWAISHPLYHAEVNDGMKWALANIPYFTKWYRFLLFWASGDLLHEMLHVDPDWKHPDVSLNEENHKFRDRLLAHIRTELHDRPDLIEKVTPDYPPYGKRMLRDNNWYQMLKRDNVDLVTGGVKAVEPDAIVDADGGRHPVDVIVLATGFQASRMLWPMEVTGRDGAVLREVWDDDDAKAYLGITVPSFPNMFILSGPNTGLSHGGSMFFQVECQVRYVMQCLREMVECDLSSMEVRPEPYEEFVRRVDEAHSRMVWSHRGMTSWYHNSKRRVTAILPWRLVDYWRMTYALNPADYQLTPAR